MNFYDNPAVRQGAELLGITDMYSGAMAEVNEVFITTDAVLTSLPVPIKYKPMAVPKPVWSYNIAIREMYGIFYAQAPEECKFVVQDAMTIKLDKKVYAALVALLRYGFCKDPDLNASVSNMIKELLFNKPDIVEVTTEDLINVIMHPKYDDYTYQQICDTLLECVASPREVVRHELMFRIGDRPDCASLAEQIIYKFNISSLDDLKNVYKEQLKTAKAAKAVKKGRRVQDATTDFIIAGLEGSLSS